MEQDNFLENLSAQQIDLGARVFDLVVGRVLIKTYEKLDEKDRESIKKAFLSEDDKEKERAAKQYIPDFKKLFKEEAKKIEEEIKAEIEKQI
jgi:dsRNA-specific ribonuclease